MAGVYNRRLFKMANGGMPPDMVAMPPPGMPPGMPPEVPPGMAQLADEELTTAAGEMAAEEISAAADDAAMESVDRLQTAGDFRDLMNAVWEDDADIESYRSRLAEVVGRDDADRTPDSVLALVQPTLQLAQLDQGIGALMQEELAEVGDLGGGITELAAKSAVADGMSAETGALVDAVGSMAQGPGILSEAPEDIDPMMLQALVQGPGPMDQGMV